MIFDLIHFIRPEWLLLAPMVVVLWFWLNKVTRATNWQDYLPQKTLEVLRVGQSSTQKVLRWCMLLCSLLVVLAAAGPSWVKQSVPALQNQRALVILLDLSPSMMSADVTPNRITRARYELLDVLRVFSDGQIGLVAYAGSAHIVSPLTDDPASISVLVHSLSPSLMPQAGSNIEAATELAQRLLNDAGIIGGDLLLITDGVDENALSAVANSLSSRRSLSILGVGGSDPTPIPAANGGFIQNSKGDIVLTQLPVSTLQELARRSGGRFSTLSNDDADISSLINDSELEGLSNNTFQQNGDTQSSQKAKYDNWSDMGYIFVLLALPLFLLLFRKGAIYLILIAVLAPLPAKVEAVELNWRDLFQTKDQQASKLMSESQYAEAAKTFNSAQWSAAAHYRNGDYEAAALQLEGREDVASIYNRATALAMSGKLPEAIETYDRVLEQQAEHADATHNKKVLEEILKQQQEQQQDQSSEDQQGDPKDDQQQSNKDSQNSTQNGSDENKEGNKENASESAQNQKNQQQSEGQQSENSQSNQTDQERQDSQDQTSEPGEQDQDAQSSESEPDSANADTQQQNEQAQDGEENQAASARQDQGNENDTDPEAAQIAAQASDQQAPLSENSEQWLRSITDDPAGLLRRKFQDQARQRNQLRDKRTPVTPSEERY